MSAGPVGGERRLMAQRVLGESLRLLLANFGILFPIALAPALLVEAGILAVLPPLTGPEVEAGAFPAGLYWAAFVSSLAGHIIVALVTLAGVDCVAGRTRGLDGYVRITLSNLFPIIVLGTIVSLLAGAAAMFFVLPGVYVYAVLFVWLPCLLYERRGFGALARAQALTQGYRWPLVGAIGSLILIFIGVIMLFGPIWSAFTGQMGEILAALLSACFSALSYAVIGIFGGLVYLRLRHLEDGTTAEQVAAAL